MKSVLLASSILFLAAPHLAFAQTPPPSEAEVQTSQIDDIVVTATKREQTLQQAPVAVSVTSAQTLERAQIRDVADLASVVPSLRVAQSSTPAGTNFFIRGFGNGSGNIGIEPSVGVFVDGVYRSRAAAQISDFPDVQRVEVLRGPQSTLFGKNASAGVVSVITREPQFTFGGNLEGSYGNYDATVLKGVVTGPVSETVAASLAGGINRRDGYLSNGGPAPDENERNRWFARGQLLFKPSDDWKIRLIADYSDIDEQCCGVLNLQRSAATGVVEALGGRVNDPGTPYADAVFTNRDGSNDIANYGASGQIDYQRGPFAVTSITAYRRVDSRSSQDSDFTSADLFSIPQQSESIRTFTQELRLASDFDGPLNFLAGAFYSDETIETSSQVEVGSQFRNYANALMGGSPGSTANVAAIEAQFGALAGDPGLYTGRFFAAGQSFASVARLENQTYSLFGQIDFDLTDRITLTAGLNYSHDAKDYSVSALSTEVFSSLDLAAIRASATNAGIAQTIGGLLGAPGGFASPAQIAGFASANPAGFAQISAGAGAATAPILALRSLQILPPFLGVPNAIEDGRTDDGDFSYTARLSYAVSDRINAYLSYATGFKASSINLSRDSRPSAADLLKINAAGLGLVNLNAGSREAGPEDSAVYEIGLKGNWGVASINVAAFDQVITGFQSNVFTGTGFYLANAGKQSVRGVEIESTVRPVEPLMLSLAVTYLDAEYDDFKLSSVGDLSGTRPAGIPEISATLAAEYEKPFANGDRLLLRADYHFESEVAIVEGLPGFLAGGTAAAITAAAPFEREVNDVNLSATYALASGLEFTLWGRNVFDDRYITTIFDSVAQSQSVSGYSNQPRTYGMGVRYRF